MNIVPTSGSIDKRSKWLLAAILVLSFFTFSGIVLKPQAAGYVQRTTLHAYPRAVLVRSISYRRAQCQFYKNHSTRSFFTISTFDLSRIYSRQISNRINSLSMSYKSRPKTDFFFPVKTFPQNAGDHPALHLG
jgi:hypothetical protein